MSRIVLILLYLSVAFAFTAAAENEPVQRYFITNKKSFYSSREIPLTRVPLNQDVYEISYIAYTQQFADRYGQKAENVAPLDPGMQYIEVKVLTEGRNTNCYFNMLLDKKVDIDFPKEDMLHDPARLLHFVTKSREELTDHQFVAVNGIKRDSHSPQKWGRYQNNIYFGSATERNQRGPRVGGVMLHYYLHTRLPNAVILSVSTPCRQAYALQLPNPAIWIKKRAATRDYSKVLLPTPEDFHTFRLPDVLVDKLKPIQAGIPFVSFTTPEVKITTNPMGEYYDKAR